VVTRAAASTPPASRHERGVHGLMTTTLAPRSASAVGGRAR
jgi:hypothetical protein